MTGTATLYGEALEVDFLARLRDIQRFDGTLELKDQLTKDIEQGTSHCGLRLTFEARIAARPRTPNSALHDMPIDWPRFAGVIREHRRFLLTTHIRPDCDALGSCLGMAGILERLGKEVRIVNGQATPPNLRFIDPQNRIQALGVDVQPQELLADGFDLLMVLDTSAWAQLGPMGDILRGTKAKKIILDHHESSDDLAAENFRDASAEATGRLVVDAAEQLGVPLTAEIARPLLAALATDTGWFRFASTRAGTFRCAAKLLEAGAVPSELYYGLYENNTLARTKLIGRILAQPKRSWMASWSTRPRRSKIFARPAHCRPTPKT